jgi:hypothetical protein
MLWAAASFFLLVETIMASSDRGRPAIEAKIFPNAKVQENGAPIGVSVSFTNVSSRPVVLLEIRCVDGQGIEVKRDQFLGLHRRSKRMGELYHHKNLLAPGEVESFQVETPGRPGSFRHEFSLEYIALTDKELDQPAFQMVKKHAIKRNPPTHARLEEYEEYTEKKVAGTVRTVLGEHRDTAGSLPYVVDVTADMLKRAETRVVVAVLHIVPDPEIQGLHAVHPDVRDYRAGVPHFGLAYLKDTDLFVGRKGTYRKLGAVDFAAIAHLGSLVEQHAPIRISLGFGAACLQDTFAGRIQPPDPNIGQAVEVGQGLPFVEVRESDLDTVWRCMERDRTSLQVTQYYKYLVVSKIPPRQP